MRGLLVAILSAAAAAAAAVATPRVVLLTTSPAQLVALDGGYLRRFAAPEWTPLPPVPAPGLRELVVGPDRQLYGARADRVLRLDGGIWRQVAQLPQRVEQMVPAPDGSPALVVLTGRPAEPVLAEGRVWRLDAATGRVVRVTAVLDSYRPWQLAIGQVDGEPRLAVSTFKATRYWPEPHRCHFLFRWTGGQAVPVWLGSRLSRPYLAATHADLRGDGSWRLVSLELATDGQPSLSVYRAIGFGYEGEWRSAPLPGATRLARVGGQVIAWGPGVAWRLESRGAEYEPVPLTPAPPSLDSLAEVDGRLLGWWDGAVHELDPPAPAREACLRLLAMGDILLGREVAPRIAARGGAWFWELVAPHLARADLRLANLECPITTTGTPVAKPYCFRAEPAHAEAVLRAGRIDLVSLANNHALDYGAEGLARTVDWLDAWGVVALGVGADRARAVAPRVVERAGLRVGLVAYADVPVDGPGVTTLDESTLAAEIASARSGADLLVVSVHWGQEYRATATDRQKRLGRAMVDAGADLVLGHHPHVAQPIETYRGRTIVYSLGNAIFDRTGPKVSNGLMVTIRLARSGVAVERVVPVEPRECRPVPSGLPR